MQKEDGKEVYIIDNTTVINPAVTGGIDGYASVIFSEKEVNIREDGVIEVGYYDLIIGFKSDGDVIRLTRALERVKHLLREQKSLRDGATK